MSRFFGVPCNLLTLGVLVFPSLVLIYVDCKSASSSRSKSGYNEVCNKTLKCKSQAWLGCDTTTGRCGCVKPDEMIYDTKREKCVALIGERCKFGFDGDAERNLWYEKADCVEGGQCGPSGTCSCPSGTYEDLDQTACHLVKEHGENCTRKVECNQDKLLSCVEGVCSCDPDTAIYTPTSYSYYDYDYNYKYGNPISIPSGICVRRVGSTCSHALKKYCIPNAVCNLSTNVCECSGSYIPTSDLLCGVGYDEQCVCNNSSTSLSESSGSVCSDLLVCSCDLASKNSRNAVVSNRCRCPNPEFQVYDATDKSCKGRVGSPCNPGQSKTCPPKASCVESYGVFQCECDEGYVVTKSWSCEKAYGQPCSYSSDGSSLELAEMCDEVPSLKCISGRCACPNAIDVYEEERRHCSTPVGFSCNVTSNCVGSAVCKAHPAGNFLPGRCICEDGLTLLPNGTCGVEQMERDEVERETSMTVSPSIESSSNPTYHLNSISN